MTARLILTTLAAVGLVILVPKPASAACEIRQVPQIINNQLVVVEQLVCSPTSQTNDGDTNDSPTHSPPAGSAACIIGAVAAGLDPAEYCFAGSDEDALPVITDDLVATAFRRIPLPPSTFTIQPPGGRTLVNFETNFFTDQDGTLERSVRLLGQRVDLRIEADSYTWRFGDGESITTSGPGAPYPKLLVTHNYRTKGEYGPALDITWVADYRVGGGTWQPVPGSVTIAGSPAELRAIEARPTLVGYVG